jgi:hypothetical protein
MEPWPVGPPNEALLARDGLAPSFVNGPFGDLTATLKVAARKRRRRSLL